MSVRARATLSSACAACILLLTPVTAHGQVLISQVFGGGGNAGSPYTHDFVELFNRGPRAESLDGWSLQFGSATSTAALGASSSTLTVLSGMLLPGQYLLVRGASGGTAGSPLPAPDITDPTPAAIAAAAHKVALARTTTSLGSACPVGAAFSTLVADFVGFGAANCWEGFGAAVAGSNLRGLMRLDAGCRDRGDNTTDFVAIAPLPRTRASAPVPCRTGAPPGSDPTVVPEPATMITFVTGLALVAFAARGRREQLARVSRR